MHIIENLKRFGFGYEITGGDWQFIIYFYSDIFLLEKKKKREKEEWFCFLIC